MNLWTYTLISLSSPLLRQRAGIWDAEPKAKYDGSEWGREGGLPEAQKSEVSVLLLLAPTCSKSQLSCLQNEGNTLQLLYLPNQNLFPSFL